MKPMDVRGLKDLNRALKQLGRKGARNALRSGIRAGGRVLVKDARRRAPYRTLKKAMTVKVNRQKSPYEITAQVGPTAGKKAKYDAWWAHIVEYGAEPHEIVTKKKTLSDGTTAFGKRVMHPGLPPRPFLRPAFEQSKQQMVKAMGDKIWDSIKKQAAKLR